MYSTSTLLFRAIIVSKSDQALDILLESGFKFRYNISNLTFIDDAEMRKANEMRKRCFKVDTLEVLAIKSIRNCLKVNVRASAEGSASRLPLPLDVKAAVACQRVTYEMLIDLFD